ncbi:MAG: F0F1 ATP synthase subunit alpha [bacterium]|nr:F0F1 ATP synthase subunit alpha [bacterium]
MNTILIEKIKKEIEALEPKTSVERVGTVVKAGDGIAEIDGLQNAMMAEMVIFEHAGGKHLKDTLDAEPIVGFVLNLEEDFVKAVILSGAEKISEGMIVKGTGKTLSIPVSNGMVGRVVNALGEPIDGKGAIKEEDRMPIERIAFGVIDRAGVDTPVHTGIKAIDSMIPIGRGQRELIIGDRGTGKTAIALDTILNQITEPKETRPICIYVAIGQKESKIARIVGELEERGAMAYSIVVVAGASEAAALQYLAPFTGATIGEFFMLKGKDAVVVYDDLSKHAVAYRQMSLLLRRPPGREAYPGDIFYLHSRLLERAAKLSEKLGGGSLTALPIIETQQGDVSAYIPTNVISITDGQIYLDTDLFNKGMRPAVNVGLSVSRVGSNAQTKAMKKVAGKIRLELAQFRELEAFMQFASDLDKETKERIEKGRRLSELLKQTNGRPLSFEKEVLVIYAGVNGFIDKVKVEDMRIFEDKLAEYFDHHASGIVDAIKKDRAISDETEVKLKLALADFATSHPELHIAHK